MNTETTFKCDDWVEIIDEHHERYGAIGRYFQTINEYDGEVHYLIIEDLVSNNGCDNDQWIQVSPEQIKLHNPTEEI